MIAIESFDYSLSCFSVFVCVVLQRRKGKNGLAQASGGPRSYEFNPNEVEPLLHRLPELAELACKDSYTSQTLQRELEGSNYDTRHARAHLLY